MGDKFDIHPSEDIIKALCGKLLQLPMLPTIVIFQPTIKAPIVQFGFYYCNLIWPKISSRTFGSFDNFSVRSKRFQNESLILLVCLRKLT